MTKSFNFWQTVAKMATLGRLYLQDDAIKKCYLKAFNTNDNFFLFAINIEIKTFKKDTVIPKLYLISYHNIQD